MTRLAPLLLLTLAPLALAQPKKPEEPYRLGPDSLPRPGVPNGALTQHSFASAKVFPGTTRDYWVYVPAQYRPDGPVPCLMVFQDGVWYRDPKGQFRVPTVLDNLIADGRLPLTVAVFVNPGEFPAKAKDGKPGRNRSLEYDTLSPAYVNFLETELLPEVAKSVRFRDDAAGRGVGGISSGGICAFTAAWERPDRFSKVLSHVGSFTNIRHGDTYPGIVRKAKPVRPIRVFLQGGEADLDNEHGNWPLANRQMGLALKYAKYDYRLEMGVGGHNGIHGGAILPEALEWLWRGEGPRVGDKR